jgi:hypothetical protein
MYWAVRFAGPILPVKGAVLEDLCYERRVVQELGLAGHTKRPPALGIRSDTFAIITFVLSCFLLVI